MLIVDELDGKRIYRCTDTGRTALSVTTIAAAVVSQAIPFQAIHSLEGVGCHRAVLDWLAYRAGWLPQWTAPPKPALHPDAQRWTNVIANAVAGMAQWVEKRQVEPMAIEQPSVNWRYGLAGTPDLKARLVWAKRPTVTVVELKFVAALSTAHRVQTRLYRRLEGYEDCRMGLLLRISRQDGAVEELPVYWGHEPELDAQALWVVSRWR